MESIKRPNSNAGWLMVAVFAGLAAYVAVNGHLPTPPSVLADSAPATLTSPVGTPVTGELQLGLMVNCDGPVMVGAFRVGQAGCSPAQRWTLAEFGEQLVALGLLASDEQLAVPPVVLDERCPLVILRGAAASGARLCFAPEGSVYRGASKPGDSLWRWQYAENGEWQLARAVASGN